MVDDVDICKEFSNFLQHPLKYYNTSIVDVFLAALGHYHKCHVKVIQADATKCWEVELPHISVENAPTLLFARSLADHIDPILKKVSRKSDSGNAVFVKTEEAAEETTFVCPMCSFTFYEIDIFKKHVPSCSPVKVKQEAREKFMPKLIISEVITLSDSDDDGEIANSENRNDDTFNEVTGNDEPDNEITENEIPFLSEVNMDSECFANTIEINEDNRIETSSDEEVDNNSICTTQYLHGDPALPLHSKGSCEYSYSDVFKILTTDINEVCEKTPHNVDFSSSYMVDCSRLSLIDDIKANDCEKMEHHGQKLRKICLNEDGQCVEVKKTYEISDSIIENIYYMYLYISKTECKNYNRRIYFLYKDQKRSIPHRYAFVHFQVNDAYKQRYMTHGNSKKNETLSKRYRQTMPSTIQSLREASERNPPKKSIEVVRRKMGSLISNPSESPKNYNQAAYARRMALKDPFKGLNEVTDALTNAAYKCKKPGDDFVRMVNSAPEALVVIASNTQISDVARFCCDPDRKKASIFCIDLTFKLGDFYVTTTSYKNPMLVNRNGSHPIHIGPMQIQHRKLLSSYKFFVNSLSTIEPRFKNLKIFGSDGEKNIIDAVNSACPSAENLQCSRHFEKPIENRLKGWGKEARQCVINDILGDKSGTMVSLGLVDCKTEEEFSQNAFGMKERWDNLEKKNASGSSEGLSFFEWFMNEKFTIMKNTMIMDVRLRNGFLLKQDITGTDYCANFLTNDVENVNSQIKKWNCSEKKEMDVFIEDMRELVKAQEHQYVDAISGTGDVSFSPEFKHLAIGDDYFIKVRTGMPQRQLKEVLLCPLESVEVTEEPVPLSTSSLDSVSLCHLPTWIPETTCLRLLSDAKRIFSENKVRRSFQSEKEFEVPKDHTNYPQKLTLTKSGLVQCKKKECLDYSTYNICRHSLAVSAFTNTLPVLISEAGKAKNRTINLLQLANCGNPSGAGTKAGYSKKRKSSKLSSSQPASKRAFLPSDLLPSSAQMSSASSIPSSPMSSAPSIPSSTMSSAPSIPSSTMSSAPSIPSSTMSSASSIPSSPMSSAPPLPSSPMSSAPSIPLKSKKILSPMSSKRLDQCKSLISFVEEPWIPIGTFHPAPPLPEPQDQCYELVKRKGKISTCSGCKLSFDKTDSNLYILGRNEYDWHIKVEKEKGRKRYEIGRKNQYYCLKRSCILMKRPFVNISLIKVVSFVIPEEISLPASIVEEELGNTVEYV